MCLRSYAILFELVTYSMFLVRGRIEFFGRNSVFERVHQALRRAFVSAVRWTKKFRGVFWRHVIEKFKYIDADTL